MSHLPVHRRVQNPDAPHKAACYNLVPNKGLERIGATRYEVDSWERGESSVLGE